MTEFELFVSWLAREKIEHEIEQGDTSGGLDIVILDTYTETRVSFLNGGTFSFMGSSDE